MLTAERLRSLLIYESDTGTFRWRHDKKGGARAGDVAGNIDVQIGYVQVGIDGANYRAHRLAWLYIHGRWPFPSIDHINRDRSDNRIVNLREASHALNAANAGLFRTNSSGVKGVSYDATNKNWHAYIHVNGKRVNLGRTQTKESAVKLRFRAELEYRAPILQS